MMEKINHIYTDYSQWRIRYDKNEVLQICDDWAQTHAGDLEIWIRTDMSREIFLQTLVHEAVHGHFFDTTIPEHRPSHQVVHGLGQFIVSFIRRNPELVQRLQELAGPEQTEGDS